MVFPQYPHSMGPISIHRLMGCDGGGGEPLVAEFSAVEFVVPAVRRCKSPPELRGGSLTFVATGRRVRFEALAARCIALSRLRLMRSTIMSSYPLRNSSIWAGVSG